MTGEIVWRAETEARTDAAAAGVAPHLSPPMRVFLSGPLGAGKTRWTRAALRALGERGRVPSPSYALAHTYRAGGRLIHHLDCFRLQGAALGGELLELLDDDALCFVEWPECAADLPPPDLRVRFDFDKESEDARRIVFTADNEVAAAALRRLPA